MRVLACGDIHGGFKALKQCFERSQFNYERDKLIVLGDVVDGWPETPECIEELLKIKNMVFVMGNHDQWAYEWMVSGKRYPAWVEQGGQATLDAYVTRHGDLIAKHREQFFSKAPYYYIDEKNRLFLHGGIPQSEMFKPDMKYGIYIGKEFYPYGDLMWDRTLADRVLKKILPEKFQGAHFKEIYLGHTTTSRYSSEPVTFRNVTLLDQGAGWEGKLSLMDIDTKRFWQSDFVYELYPEVKGRR